MDPVFRIAGRQEGCRCEPKAAAEPTPADKLRRSIGGPGVSEQDIANNEVVKRTQELRRQTTVPSPVTPTVTRREYIDAHINRKKEK